VRSKDSHKKLAQTTLSIKKLFLSNRSVIGGPSSICLVAYNEMRNPSKHKRQSENKSGDSDILFYLTAVPAAVFFGLIIGSLMFLMLPLK